MIVEDTTQFANLISITNCYHHCLASFNVNSSPHDAHSIHSSFLSQYLFLCLQVFLPLHPLHLFRFCTLFLPLPSLSIQLSLLHSCLSLSSASTYLSISLPPFSFSLSLSLSLSLCSIYLSVYFSLPPFSFSLTLSLSPFHYLFLSRFLVFSLSLSMFYY